MFTQSLRILLVLAIAGGGLTTGFVAPTQAQQSPPLPAGDGWRRIEPQAVPPQTLGNPQQQQFPQQQPFDLESRLLVRAGGTVQAAYRGQGTLIMGTGETRPLTMTLDAPIQDQFGNVVVPAGSVVEGSFQPTSGGSRFVANAMVINGQSYPLRAQSDVIAPQRDPRHVSGGAIAEDAAIGAGIGVVLSGLLGNRVISTEKVLGAAALGAVVGNVTAPNAIVVRPDTPLSLTVTEDFRPVANNQFQPTQPNQPTEINWGW